MYMHYRLIARIGFESGGNSFVDDGLRGYLGFGVMLYMNNLSG